MEAATSLQLQTGECRVTLKFDITLNPVQYETLLARLPQITRIVELRQFARALAKQWGCEASVVEVYPTDSRWQAN